MSTSQLYNLYKDRLARCKSPSELVTLSKEINLSPLNKAEKAALALGCIFAAKYFDKHGVKKDVQDLSLECPDQT